LNASWADEVAAIVHLGWITPRAANVELPMDWDDYLWDQAAHYRQLAETAEDPLIRQEHFELAAKWRITSRIA
jgi:hypothetical protein